MTAKEKVNKTIEFRENFNTKTTLGSETELEPFYHLMIINEYP